MSSFFSLLTGQLSAVFVLLAYRVLPYFIYVYFTKRVKITGKILFTLIYGFIVIVVYCRLGNLTLVFLTVAILSFVYFSFASSAIYWLTANYKLIRYGYIAIFVLCAIIFVVFPGLVITTPIGLGARAAGWELMFSSYSYIIESQSSKRRLSYRECMFFLLVNPVLVVTERGKQISNPDLSMVAVLRIGIGLISLISYHIVFCAVKSFSVFRPMKLSSFIDIYSYGYFVLFYGAYFIGHYFSHSGLASLQIGLMRLFGYHIPERYHYPWLAIGPGDFWRRWNIYVTGWARRYLYYPMAHALGRRWRNIRIYAAQAVSILCTFVLLGFFHDVFSIIDYINKLPHKSCGFVGTVVLGASGVVLIVWVAITKLLAYYLFRYPFTRQSYFIWAGRRFSQILFVNTVLVLTWYGISQ